MNLRHLSTDKGWKPFWTNAKRWRWVLVMKVLRVDSRSYGSDKKSSSMPIEKIIFFRSAGAPICIYFRTSPMICLHPSGKSPGTFHDTFYDCGHQRCLGCHQEDTIERSQWMHRALQGRNWFLLWSPGFGTLLLWTSEKYPIIWWKTFTETPWEMRRELY